MIKYYCDRCGAEILFDDVVRVEMSRDRAWEAIGDSLKYKDIILCPKCISAFNEFMQEGKNLRWHRCGCSVWPVCGGNEE